jgi:simple sugar transport system ATP-binding protein
MRSISKGFPGVQALDGVDFTLRRGEIHGLMGENGAGKSTLVKVLTGVYRRDTGQATLDGLAINPHSPKAAEALGISTVYQEVNLIPHLSVAENICLGREPTTLLGTIRWNAVARRARQAMARLGLDIDVGRQLASCSIAIQQMVALARALDVSAKLLILDEPTSSLDDSEVQELFAVMRRLREAGLGIVFITHFLDQVYEITDRITILRNGKLVGEYETRALPRLSLVSRMLGREPEPAAEWKRHLAASAAVDPASGILPLAQNAARCRVHPAAAAGGQSTPPLLEAQGLGRRGSIAPTDLTVRRGEVVGLAGLLGSGRTELARLLFGVDRPDTGRLLVDGRPVALRSPRRAIAVGFAFTPEDRKVAGIIPTLSVRENIVLALQASRGPWRPLKRDKQNEIANRFIQALGIKTPSAETPVEQLSGGNQQKVLLARWLATEPRLLILDEPTRGIDVGAKAEIEKLIASLRAAGLAILFISSELEEVVRDSQRVVILRDRSKIGELTGGQIDLQAIMHAIARHEEAPQGSQSPVAGSP